MPIDRTFSIPCHLISSHLISSLSIPSHPDSSHLISSHLASSHLITFHPIISSSLIWCRFRACGSQRIVSMGLVRCRFLGMRLETHCTRGLFRCWFWPRGLQCIVQMGPGPVFVFLSFFLRARGGLGARAVVKARPPGGDAQLGGLWRTGSAMAHCAGGGSGPHRRPWQGTPRAAELPAVYNALACMVHETY